MSSFVVVIIASDGTVSVQGSKHARAFTTSAGAQKEAQRWDDGSRQIEVCEIDNDTPRGVDD